MNETDKLIEGKMQNIARSVDNEIPDNYGFIVMVFPFNKTDGRLIYASNANREDVVDCMKEFIKKTENSYGKDI